MIIECVPNISEGRDLRVIEQIGEAISSVSNVKLLDIHSDSDHNRSVFTFIGAPQAVSIAAFKLTELALKLISLPSHEGVHPRIGVVDVIPFVPVQNASYEDCTHIAINLGQQISNQLYIPVYYYGLTNIETQDFASLYDSPINDKYTSLPELRKNVDLNKQNNHPTAGAIAIGVRDFMVAYNVNLNTKDLAIAKQIASKIREKNGGLPGVRALGFELKSRGIVQVSMNLIEPKVTGPEQVFEAIKREAELDGVTIAGDELVGLLPKQVLAQAD